MSDEFDSPALVMHRLQAIERDLALKQNEWESVTRQWYDAQREMGKIRAEAMLVASEKYVAEKKARAELAAYDVPGAESQGEYEALKAVIGVLDKRAMINQSLLKAHGRI